MSTDAEDTKLFNGDNKKDWKEFYDDAIRICRQELGSEAVKWFEGEVEEVNAENLQRAIHDEYYLICKTGKVTYADVLWNTDDFHTLAGQVRRRHENYQRLYDKIEAKLSGRALRAAQALGATRFPGLVDDTPQLWKPQPPRKSHINIRYLEVPTRGQWLEQWLVQWLLGWLPCLRRLG